MSGDADTVALLTKLIAMVENVQGELTTLRGEVADLRAAQVRTGVRLAQIDTHLDEHGHTVDDLLRP